MRGGKIGSGRPKGCPYDLSVLKLQRRRSWIIESSALSVIWRSAIANATATAPTAKGRKASGFASTGFFIVPIAGRRAKLAW